MSVFTVRLGASCAVALVLVGAGAGAASAQTPGRDGGYASHVSEPLPSDVGPAPVVSAASTASVTLAVDGDGVFSGTVHDSNADGVPAIAVVVTATPTGGGALVSATVATSGSGTFSGSLALASGSYSVVAVAQAVSSLPASVTVSPRLSVSASVPATVSENAASLTVLVTDRGVPSTAQVTVTRREPTDGADVVVGSASAVNGSAVFSVSSWRNPTYVVSVSRNGAAAAVSVVGVTVPRFPVTTLPAGAPVPANQYPLTSAPAGAGANASSRAIPQTVWSSMVGVSWHSGCIARSKLRLVEANYIGFDGYRHRGQLVVNKAIASKTRTILTRFFAAGYPLRQMRLVDAYGRNSGRPGANDYKSMAADNTSGFNCRYVVGKEKRKVNSPHAAGRSLDINTWENPYVSPTGTYPNRFFLNRKLRTRATWFSGSPQLRIMRAAGCSWGGSYRDYHHFDC